SLRLGDRFGDSGLVGIGILEEKGNAWHLDNFLMSCRVIGRDAEGLLIWKIAEDARKSAMAEITGEVLPTKKNKIAESFFADHDFAPVPASATGWNLDISKTGLAPPQWINLLEN
ncbi:MAG: hypothetical protein QGF09_05430, partial [Rhodospirillales bacterium]|nr:hypothetical protein [Rhodospirillales bacterium]